MSKRAKAGKRQRSAATTVDAALPAIEWTGATLAAEPARAATATSAMQADLARDAANAAGRRLGEAIESRELLDHILQRWQNTSTEQLAGRLGEFHPVATFNMNAAEIAANVRARITEFQALNDPHSPVDILITDGDGVGIAGYQSKVVTSVAQRITELAQPKYANVTGLIVPSDHVGPVIDKIDARIAGADPQFLARPAYESVRARVSDTLTHEDVSSDPISHEELLQAARNPRQYGDDLIRREASATADRQSALASEVQAVRLATALQVGSAAAGGACAAAVVTGAVQGLIYANQVRTGDMSARDALTETARLSGRAALQGGYVGAIGQSISLAAQSDLLPSALASGPLPFYVARATWDVAATSVLLARGEIDPREAAVRTAQSLTRLTCSYAGMLVGQALIPIPIVGGLVGATAGSLCASVVLDALSAVLTARRELEMAKKELKILRREVKTAISSLDAETTALRAYVRQQERLYATTISPALDDLDKAVERGDYASATSHIETVIAAFGGTPPSQTREQFVAWAMDPASRLVLDPNPNHESLALAA